MIYFGYSFLATYLPTYNIFKGIADSEMVCHGRCPRSISFDISLYGLGCIASRHAHNLPLARYASIFKKEITVNKDPAKPTN